MMQLCAIALFLLLLHKPTTALSNSKSKSKSKLGINERNWQRKFEQLKNHKSIHGNFKIPKKTDDDSTLNSWADTQRGLHRRGLLKDHRLEQLAGIGFLGTSAANKETASSRRQAKWLERYDELLEYKRVNGHCRVPQNYKENPKLGLWVKTNRAWYKDRLNGQEDFVGCANVARMTDERFELLRKIGFYTDDNNVGVAASKKRTNWDEYFEQLCRHREQHGTLHVDWKAHPRLARWTSRQRFFYQKMMNDDDADGNHNISKGSSSLSTGLTNEKIAQLESIGFNFTSSQTNFSFVQEWRSNFNFLRELKAQHGTIEAIIDTDEYPELTRWMSTQQDIYEKRSGKLTIEKIDQLREIGLLDNSENGNGGSSINIRSRFQLRQSRWMERYRELQQYRKEHGHFNVPRNYSENPQLGRWVNSQRYLFKKRLIGDKTGFENMSDTQFELLENIRFYYETYEDCTSSYITWDDYIDQLCKHKEACGTLQVDPQINPQLARWVYRQRVLFKKLEGGKQVSLSYEQVERLQAIGFEFEGRKSWDDRYDELCEHLALNGPNSFSIDRKENFGLSQWIYFQKREYAQMKNINETSALAPERMELLDKIGFDWGLNSHADWWEKYAQLCEYKEQYGDCNVPQRYSENLSLGLFVYNNRMMFKNLLAGEYSSLTEDRIDALEEIGFCWDNQQYRWFSKLEDLKRYKAQYGNCDVPRRYDADLALAWWVQCNRLEYKQFQMGRPSTLSSSRIKLLEDIGFNWSAPARGRNSGPTVQDWSNLFDALRQKLAEPDGTRNFVERLDVVKDRSRPVAEVDIDTLWNEEND